MCLIFGVSRLGTSLFFPDFVAGLLFPDVISNVVSRFSHIAGFWGFPESAGGFNHLMFE